MPNVKVVLNRCHGGFGISMKAAEFMAARGNARAIEELQMFKDNGGEWWAGYNFKRDDPDLIAAVEELGDAANGACANLVIEEIYIPEPEDFILDCDGYEWVD